MKTGRPWWALVKLAMLSVARNTQRMEAPMKRAYFIGMDTHCQFCEIAAVNTRGDVVERDRCVTCIPALLEVIERVPAAVSSRQLQLPPRIMSPRLAVLLI